MLDTDDLLSDLVRVDAYPDADLDEASPADPGTVTRLLRRWSAGDRDALDDLIPLLYEELRKIALGYLRHERPDHTLEAGALVNEAFLRLVEQEEVEWRSRSHFLAIAARMMRRILLDYARRGSYAKRGGGCLLLPLGDLDLPASAPAVDLLALDEALTALERLDPLLKGLVELRYFGGLSGQEISDVLGISTASVNRRWRFARAWLFRFLTESPVGPP